MSEDADKPLRGEHGQPADAPPLPHAIAVTWGMAALPHRGPKRELSTERIVEAAIEIADADGIEAVSMGRVATALGFTPMSLYRYVTGKDDLLLLMYDAASDFVLPPVDGAWREQLRSWAVFVRAGYQAHPWLANLPPSSTPTTPNRLAIIDAALRAMRGLPVSDQAKVSIALLLLGYIGLFGNAGREHAGIDEVRAALPRLVESDRFPFLAPAVGEGVFDVAFAADERGFHFGLQRLLDGIDTWVRAAAPVDQVPEPIPPSIARDKAVREALKQLGEAEARVDAARKKAAALVEKAVEREQLIAAKQREKDEVAAAKQREKDQAAAAKQREKDEAAAAKRAAKNRD